MEDKIKQYFEQQLYPYYNRIKLTSKKLATKKFSLKKSDKPDVNKWKENGFDEKLYQALFKTSGYGNFYLISSLLDIDTTLNEWKYKKYGEYFTTPFFVDDNKNIQMIKTIFYYFVDLLPVTNICLINAVEDYIPTGLSYMGKMNIWHYNNLDIDYIPPKKYHLLSVNVNIYINNRWGLEEYVKQQQLLKYSYLAFNCLKEGGQFILHVPNMYSDLTMEIITLLSSSFEELIVFRNGWHIISNEKTLIFKNFKNNLSEKQLSDLKKVIKEWQKYEPSAGEKLNLKERDIKYLYSNLKKFNKNSGENDSFVETIGIKIDEKLRTKIKENNLKISQRIIKTLEMAEPIYQKYATNVSLIKKIVAQNINYGIQYCKMMSFNMKNQRHVLDYYDLKPIYFPIYNFNSNKSEIEFIDQYKFKITPEGEYSVTFPTEANFISNLITSVFTNDITILDGTANVGGNTISFSRFMKKVIAVELDKDNYQALCSNVALYGIKNSQLIHGDTLKHMRMLKYDVLFLDPPWGGTNYKRASVLDLKLGDKYVRDMISDLKMEGKKGLVFKLPKNFRITEQFLVGENLSIYRVKNYFCAIIRLCN